MTNNIKQNINLEFEGVMSKIIDKSIKQVKIRRESTFQSIVNDIFSLGAVGFLFWFNYNFIGNSYLVNFIIMLFIFFAVIKTAITFNKGEDRRFLDYNGISDKKIEEIINILENDK